MPCLFSIICFALLSSLAAAQTAPRWGQASALVSSYLIVYGGKTQGGVIGGGYTYSSGPSSNDLLALDLSQQFDLASPPWINITANVDNASWVTPPAVAFGALAPLTHQEVLLFGGDGSPTIPIQTGNDSAYRFQLVKGDDGQLSSAQWTKLDASSAQPMRRVYSSVESDGKGGVWVVGGQKADGSQTALNEAWRFNSSSDQPQFEAIDTPQGGGVVGVTTTLLSDGSLLVLGGQDATGQLVNMQTLNIYDTSSHRWRTISTSASKRAPSPQPRRNHVAVSLPGKRVFVHGGASDATMTNALDDAWLLDWSTDPASWTQVAASSGSSPSARYGHSAVAYGNHIVMAMGWAGYSAADSNVYAFDASNLAATNPQGGGWMTTSYRPDDRVSSSGSGQSGSSGAGSSDAGSSGAGSSAGSNTGSSSANNAGGNGASTSSGGSLSSSGSDSSGSSGGSNSNGNGNGNGNGNDGTSASTNPTNATPTSTDDGNNSTNDGSGGGTSAGVKAGAVIGAFVFCGLVLAAGSYLYQRHRQMQSMRSGDGSKALLAGAAGAGGRRPGDGDGDEEAAYGSGAEKGWYAYAPSRSRSAQYKQVYSDADVPAQSNLGPGGLTGSGFTGGGLAREGSGPRIHQRLALLTGLSSWGAADPRRFDMLADEDDYERRYRRSHQSDMMNAGVRDQDGRRAASFYQTRFDVDDEDDDVVDAHGFGTRGRGEYGMDFGGGVHDPRSAYVTSPFEDEDGGRINRRNHDLDGQDDYDGYGIDDQEEEAHPMTLLNSSRQRFSLESSNPDDDPSTQSHSSSSRPSSQSNGGHTSFSNTPSYDSRRRFSSYGRRAQAYSMPAGPRLSDGSGSLMKRSPTWWDRLMDGTGLIERTASGRLAPSPGAHEPIRDPAPPPALSVIKESPRSLDVSEHETPSLQYTPQLPTLGELGVQPSSNLMSDSHFNRSLSSLQSRGSSLQSRGSSHLESHLQNMDVIQRTRTASSGRTASTKRTGTGHGHGTPSAGSSIRTGPLSRMGSVREDEAETPGQVIWQGSDDWVISPGPMSGVAPGETLLENREAEADEDADATATKYVIGDESMDIVAQKQRGPRPQRQQWQTFDDSTQGDEAFKTRPLRSSSSTSSSSRKSAPTTPHKAGRPQLTVVTPRSAPRGPRTPVTAAAKSIAKKHTPTATPASVRERVREIERRRLAEAAAQGTTSPTRTKGRRSGPLSPRSDAEEPCSPLTQRISHGLVPKPQLYVANPDDSRDG